MNEPASAAIHIQGSSIRWAEVVHRDGAKELRRGGQQTFEVDVMAVLRGEAGDANTLERMQALLEEELAGSEAPKIHVVVHPLDVFSFFTPITAELSERDRMRQVVQQAALVTGTRSPDALRITPQTLRTVEVEEGNRVEWIHVLAVPKGVKSRIEELVGGLSPEDHIQWVSTEATARCMGFIETKETPPPELESRPFRLAIGQYPTHSEFSLTRAQSWHHAHTAEVTRPSNILYYAVGFLNRIGVPLREIGRLYLYGTDLNQEPSPLFDEIFGFTPTLLDPSGVFNQFSAEVEGESASGYVPCLGATLELSSS